MFLGGATDTIHFQGMIMNDKVAVVIPNHNYGQWVCAAIESASRSTYKNLIIGVVDDSSTDDSVDKIYNSINIVDNFQDWEIGSVNDIPVVYYQSGGMSKGPAWARNKFIKSVFCDNVDYFIPLDSDDEFYPDRIEKLLGQFTDPIIGGVYSDYHVETPDGIVIEYKKPFDLDLLQRENIVHSSCMFRSECVRDFGAYDKDIWGCEDYDLWLRFAQKYLFVHVPEPTMKVRWMGHNISNVDYNNTGVGTKREKWEMNMEKIRKKWTQMQS